MFRSGNPALKDKIFDVSRYSQTGEYMSIEGTVNKSFLLLLISLVPAVWIWHQFLQGMGSFLIFLYGGLIVGFILALITVFKKEWSPVTAPLYALAEGFVIGGLSVVFEQMFSGIVIQAVALTFGVFLVLLLVYKSKLIKVTENFKLGIVAATGAIALIYLVTFILSFFGISIPYIHGNGLIGIGFSVVVVIIAALNLVLDFDFIEKGAQSKIPKFMEWYAAFGLLVTLIWLYIEILRLLSKIRSSR